jgi:hypothetical protein
MARNKGLKTQADAAWRKRPIDRYVGGCFAFVR